MVNTSMSTTVKWRLVAFVLAIGMMVSLSVWAALASWNRIDDMRRQLNQVQSDSFRLADQFQQSILSLNNLLLRYQVRQKLSTWQEFLQVGEKFERSIAILILAYQLADAHRKTLIQFFADSDTSLTTLRKPHSSPSIAPPCRKPCWRANYSVMNGVPSPARKSGALAALSRLIRAPSSWMKSAI
jgi:hypothetical protein